MMRSLYSGVSGLQNHQTRMDVLGNNISNVNTIGFKKGRVNFQDILSQTMSGAARPTEERGGVNPQQIGLGMNIAAIDTIHTQGSLQTTGVMTDIAVQGNGFFIMRDGAQQFYTRAGAFGIDEDGVLVNPSNGMRVQGWMAEDVEGQMMINTASDVRNLIIPVGSKDPAGATTEVELACNLDKRTSVIGADATQTQIREGTWSIDKEIYDAFGNTHTMRINFTRAAEGENRWQGAVEINPHLDEDSNTQVSIGGDDTADTFYLEFNNLGTIQAVVSETGERLDTGRLEFNIGFDVPFTDDTLEGDTRQNFLLSLGEAGSVVNTVTQFAERNSTKAFRQNGYPMGYLDDFRIDQTGTITGVFSNGTTRTVGQIGLATFTNPGGLEKAGESTFQVTNNSGEPDIGESGIAGKGRLIAGALEMSNVDLAEEFTDMIVTQRGFQANSKTIQTADQLLQEVLTLKR